MGSHRARARQLRPARARQLHPARARQLRRARAHAAPAPMPRLPGRPGCSGRA